jgi:nucleoid-associated protein YgaU
MSRYLKRLKATNDSDQYYHVFQDRGVTQIEQYRTPEFLVYEQDVLDSVEFQKHEWKMGDTYWRLSSQYYGTPKHWWVIASFNRKPTESHISVGETIKIPFSLSEALQVTY